MLCVFQLDVYAFLDPQATLSFMTPYIALNVYVNPKILSEPFFESTHFGESILVK